MFNEILLQKSLTFLNVEQDTKKHQDFRKSSPTEIYTSCKSAEVVGENTSRGETY